VRAGNSIRPLSCGTPVFMDEPTEYVSASNPVESDEGCRVLPRTSGWCSLLEGAVGAMRVVVRDVYREDSLELAAMHDEEPVEALVAEGADPSFGERVRVRCAHRCLDRPDALGSEHLVERAAANLLSRSWIRNRIGPARSTNVWTTFRACWVTHSAVGFVVMPARCSCRVASSMNTSTYKRRNNRVSTVKKSQATIPLACARRNSRHVSDDRRGTGAMPACRRIVQTVLAAILMPSVASSPWIRR
jgi:hypothetical protein